ncbi:MAG: hypothetical protein Q7R61_00270 [bacterium]|nr:hypothetical protein [bacterium]
MAMGQNSFSLKEKKEKNEDQIIVRMIRALDMALSAHMSSRVNSAAESMVVGHLAVKIYDELKELDRLDRRG